MEWYNIITVGLAVTVAVLIVIGNSLVILSWIFHSKIRNPVNLYLVSLSFADLLVGVILFPLYISSHINDGLWPFGEIACKIYLITLVVLCSVSILHLLVIAIDRYRAISEGVQYIQKRSYAVAAELILFVYVYSFWIAFPLLSDWETSVHANFKLGYCTANKTLGWTIHLSFGMFFLPGFILVRTYIRIYHKIQRRFVKKNNRSTVPPNNVDNYCMVEISLEDSSTESQERSNTGKEWKPKLKLGKHKKFWISHNNIQVQTEDTNASVVKDLNQRKVKLCVQREKQAAKTLGLIIGCFALSWFPLFCIYPFLSFVPSGTVPPLVIFTLVGIGYSNSVMNPIIYTLYNQDFRDGYRKVLCCWLWKK